MHHVITGVAPMKLRYPPLNELKTFHAVAQTGRFRKAAELLSVTESAVSHQIRRLERTLGVQLFEKHGREMQLSATGLKYYDAVRRALESLSQVTEEIVGAPDRARVTLTLPTSLAALWLIPRLNDLQRRHPELSLQLVTTNRVCDFDREHIDLGIRHGSGQWPDYQVTKLLPEVLQPVAGKSLWRTWRGASMATFLTKTTLIVNALHPDEWNEWFQAHDLPAPRSNNKIVLESSELVLQAAVDGVGIAIGRRPMVDRLLKSGTLVAPFENRRLTGAAYYLLSRKGATLTAPAAKLARWLKDQVR